MKNLQMQLDSIVETEKGKHLLLHSCCAPCSSYILEYLGEYFNITLLYYNPNIIPQQEYDLRLGEQRKIISRLRTSYPVTLLEGEYNPQVFLGAVKGLEQEPEGGARCAVCYRLRLREAAAVAKDIGADYFTTTLSVSPYKNAALLEEISLELEEEFGVNRLPSDFKKRGGYQRSIALSQEHDLYRQTWCGCPFSKNDQKK